MEYVSLNCPRCGAALPGGDQDTLICQYCGARLILKRSSCEQSPARRSRTVLHGMPFFPHSCIDQAMGMEALSLLVPQGWQFRGGVTWTPTRPAAPATISFQVYNPAGPEAFEVFPIQYFTWSNNPTTRMTIPEGAPYFGYEMRQPVNAQQALRKYVLPRFRKLPGLQIIDEGPAQELLQIAQQNMPNTYNPGVQNSLDAVRVRLNYTYKGMAFWEEMSCVVEYVRTITPGLFGSTETVFWDIAYGTAFRAATKELEQYSNLYRDLFSSVKINPQWTTQVQRISQGLANNTIRGIQQIGEFSRRYAQQASQMMDDNMRAWEQRQERLDHKVDQFTQAIRGVENYYDPNTGRDVELPSGYTQAWSNALGEYIVSDDPFFNPNIGSSQNWTPLNPSDTTT